MSTEKVQQALKSLGLTEKEAEVYIFLAKHHALRSGEIAKGTRTHRVEVYRLLKSLQTKGVIAATLEAPARYTAAPLEGLLDSFIKANLKRPQRWRVLNKVCSTNGRISVEPNLSHRLRSLWWLTGSETSTQKSCRW